MTAAVAGIDLPFALTRPIHVAAVGLKARDVNRVADYYRTILGLETLGTQDGAVSLGAGGTAFLEIAPLGPNGLEDDPRSAGLFHTAFLMPSRADLGRWIMRASQDRFPVDGTADHIVSEAIYLTDPEGNGVEIYADRPHEGWVWSNGTVNMSTLHLDLRPIVEAAGAEAAPYRAAPAGLRIGHVHLRVGDDQAAERWWMSEVGLQPVADYTGATFLSSGGYHHHIAGNIWRSRGATARDPQRSGLAFVEMTGSGVTAEKELVDPWGTVVRLVPGDQT